MQNGQCSPANDNPSEELRIVKDDDASFSADADESLDLPFSHMSLSGSNKSNLAATTCLADGDDGDHGDDLIPTVSIDEGALKYVFITATSPSPLKMPRSFIYSRKNAQHHVNVATYLIPKLRHNGYTDIQIVGGGRIDRDDQQKKIHIFGYSYGFGQADHAAAKTVVDQSVSYQEYIVTW